MAQRRSHRLSLDDPRLHEFWTQRHLCTLTTLRADGRPHVVPVGAVLDPATGIARVITSRDSVKARNAARGPVALCQVDGARWCTLEGHAVLRAEAAAVRDAERRYAARYRTPRENPARVVIEITVDRILGAL